MTAAVSAFGRVVAVQARLARNGRAELVAVVVEPAVFALLFGAVFGAAADPARAALAVLGAGMMGSWVSVLYSAAASLQTSRRLGTLEPLVATPTPLRRTTVATALAAALFGLVPVVVCLLVGWLAFGLRMTPASPARFAAGAVLLVAGLTAVGLLLAPMFVLYPHATALANMGDYPAFILSGIVLPAAALPAWLAPVSALLPPSWGIRMLQEGLVGAGGPLLPPLLGGVGVCLAWTVAGSWLMERLLAAALRAGALTRQ